MFFAEYAAAAAAHESSGGFLTIDGHSGGTLYRGVPCGFLVTDEIPDWREDLAGLDAAAWEAAGWDETKIQEKQ
jgi:hypothetical protein